MVPAFFNVGPGQTYATLHEVPWDAIQAGDTVQVFWQQNPYHDKIALNMRGTAAKPITIEGIPGPSGQQPTIDANGAVENPQASYFSLDVRSQGVFTIAPDAYQPDNYKPGWIVIDNLEIFDALRDAYIIRSNGQHDPWNLGAAAVAMYHCEHITVSNCWIHDNEDGIFGKSDGWEAANLRDINIDSNLIMSNGYPGEDHYHNTYIEAIGVLYQFNYYGPLVDGSAGLGLKDRSAGAVVRYNYFTGGNTMLDLVDPEDAGPAFLSDPLWGKTFVYGNVFYNPPFVGSSAFVHFGGDSGDLSIYQKNLYFYNNTVINRDDRVAGRWRTVIFDVDSNSQKIFAQNNIFYNVAATSGQTPDYWCLGETYGTFNLGTNWINSGFLDGRDGEQFLGSINGRLNLITGNNPGFVDQAHGNFNLRPDSICVGIADALNPKCANNPVEFTFNYLADVWWTPIGNKNDLGA
jgi:hypothetical protein